MNLKKASMTGLVLALGAGAVFWSAMSGKKPAPGIANPPAAHSMESMAAPAPALPREAGAAAGRLQPVAANLVCMVNNRVFPSPQIPVEFQGRTYYGCCEGCKQNLMTNREARMAMDPVSGVEVDKALATIGSLPDGRVFYFKSPEAMAAFDPGSMN